jgi:hypothetical protein
MNLGATTKQYVDSGLGTKQNSLGYIPVNQAGDTMTGTLVLHADPISNMDAVTKQYADSLIGSGSGGVSNTIYQRDSSLTVTDTGTNGMLTMVLDGKLVMTSNKTNTTYHSGTPDAWISVIESGTMYALESGGSSSKINSQNDVIVYGSVYDSSSGTGIRSCLLLKYNMDGNLLWQHSLSDSVDNVATADALVLDSSDNIIVSVINSINHDKTAVVKLDTDGNILWQVGIIENINQYDPNLIYNIVVNDMVTDSNNNIYVVGSLSLEIPEAPGSVYHTGLIVKLSGTDGTVLWQILQQDITATQLTTQSNYVKNDIQFTGAAVDSNNHLIVCGNTSILNDALTGNAKNGFVSAYDASGTQLWTNLTNVSGSTTRLINTGLDANGHFIEVKIFQGVAIGVGSTSHNNGGVSAYACGGSYVGYSYPRFTICEFVVTPGPGITALPGDMITSKIYVNSNGTYNELLDIVVTPTEIVVVGNAYANTFGQDWKILKINLPDLTLNWSTTIGFAGDEWLWWNNSSHCLDVRGNAITITGYTSQNGNVSNYNNQLMTVKIPVTNTTFSVANCGGGGGYYG